ncbi:hypothetical protein J3U65_09475 [Gilliamella sp. B3791]|uniref:hypothetical protein n=2 Tax=Gilliamella TaxID=1193503 RepID=UPI00226A2AA9|nr:MULTISPECIES: hypothetical protein [unclassified Gilliamella]MCX8642676.1 hypothetical protein [Gilliamella sp. B3835]MCX8717289.1 hypothetical protein [Gilliamella sp. B3784]MCX8719599.1 hypothetical protein [Gilliamella sp. B3788]MCX8741911.1 hypothetical protein [Gilliamella sp. B3791]
MLSGLVSHVRQPSSQHHYRRQLLLVNRPPYIVFNIKRYLALIPLLLLPYATTTQALSVTTAQVIHGSQPYLTSDNGVTKITTTEGLLGITLSDGTRITPSNNTSTLDNPIVLPKENQSFIDIAMLVPPTADAIALNTLIGEPYNYWGDDDGDGQGTNGITATGNLSVRIIDKANQVVSRSATLDICQAPYKLELTTTAGSLTTQYGLPNSRNFSSGTATYYISPKAAPKICYLYTPDAEGEHEADSNSSSGPGVGPDDIWALGKGFRVQSTEPSSYSRNFPTTGANNLYFDLDIGGIKGSALTWPTISQGGITATMTPSPDDAFNIRVTLTGPVATKAQQNSASPGSIATPSLPQTFEIVGYDSNNTAVLKYGFELKQWFVNRARKLDNLANYSSWCSNLGGGYHLPQVKDLTNATGDSWTGGTPPSTGNYYDRNIGAGLFTEWGYMDSYTAAGFAVHYYWTSDSNGSEQFIVLTNVGSVTSSPPYLSSRIGTCVYP